MNMVYILIKIRDNGKLQRSLKARSKMMYTYDRQSEKNRSAK